MGFFTPSQNQQDRDHSIIPRKTMRSISERKKAVRDLVYNDREVRKVLNTTREREAFKKQIMKLGRDGRGFSSREVTEALVSMVKDGDKSGLNVKEARQLGEYLLGREAADSGLSKARQRKLLQPLYRDSTFEEPKASSSGAGRFLSSGPTKSESAAEQLAKRREEGK